MLLLLTYISELISLLAGLLGDVVAVAVLTLFVWLSCCLSWDVELAGRTIHSKELGFGP